MYRYLCLLVPNVHRIQKFYIDLFALRLIKFYSSMSALVYSSFTNELIEVLSNKHVRSVSHCLL